MKRILPSLVLLLVGLCCGSASAQQAADQILSRNHLATVERPQARRPSFPDLPRPATSEDQSVSDDDLTTTPRVSGSLITVCSSLAVVLGLFAGLVWINRKVGGGAGNHGAIPKEVVQSLGSTPIDSRNQITMLRCGNRILVLAQNAQGVQPITEITSPDEVNELTAACLGDSKQAFAATLQSIESEPAKAGFLAGQPAAPTPRSRGQLFASA
jgi:flagellar protein FliO/FliZ